MKQHFFYPLLYTVIGGFIVLFLNYLFLSPRTNELVVYHNAQQLSPETWIKLVEPMMLTAGANSQQLEKFEEQIRLQTGSQLTIDSYEVTNSGDEVARDLSIFVDTGFIAAIEDEAGTRLINTKKENKYGQIFPGKSIRIYAMSADFSSLSSYDNHEMVSFISAGRKVTVRNLRLTPDSTETLLIYLVDNYTFWIFIFSMLSAFLWVIMIIAAIAELSTRNNIPYKAKNTSDADLVKATRILQYVRQTNPTRADQIARQAELTAEGGTA